MQSLASCKPLWQSWTSKTKKKLRMAQSLPINNKMKNERVNYIKEHMVSLSGLIKIITNANIKMWVMIDKVYRLGRS